MRGAVLLGLVLAVGCGDDDAVARDAGGGVDGARGDGGAGVGDLGVAQPVGIPGGIEADEQTGSRFAVFVVQRTRCP